MSRINKEEYRKQSRSEFEAMSNNTLFESVIGLAAGDDWDGCFTEQGAIDFEVAQEVIRERLKEWLSK